MARISVPGNFPQHHLALKVDRILKDRRDHRTSVLWSLRHRLLALKVGRTLKDRRDHKTSVLGSLRRHLLALNMDQSLKSSKVQSGGWFWMGRELHEPDGLSAVLPQQRLLLVLVSLLTVMTESLEPCRYRAYLKE